MKYKIFWRNGDDTEVEGSTISDAMNREGIGAGALSAIDYYTPIKGTETPQDILRDWFEEIGPATSAEALRGQLIVSLSEENWRKLGEACGLPEPEIEKLVEKNNDSVLGRSLGRDRFMGRRKNARLPGTASGAVCNGIKPRRR